MFASGFRLAALPVGVFLLSLINNLDELRVKQCIGAALLVAVLAQWAGRFEPHEKVSPAWGVAAFSLSGLMAGAFGMGGPALVLWLMAHKWSSLETRGFLFWWFLILLPPQIVLLYFKFAEDVFPAMAVGLACTPLIVIGAVVGLRLGDRIPKERLRVITYLILTVMAVVSILAPIFQ